MAREMATSQKYDRYSHEFRATTHETYARMHEQTPVHLQSGLDGETPMWFVTRYDDVVAVLIDNERFVRRARCPSTSGSTRTCSPRTATTIVGCADS